jgi:hypothetical protein
MVRAKSIPPELEQTVIDLYLTGRSHRAIAEHLAKKHQIETTHTSVGRTIERVSDGACSASTMATMLRLRREAPAVADRMIQTLDIMCAQAGLPSSDAALDATRIDYAKADRAHRLMERHLRLAGCTGAAAERTLEKYERVVGAAARALHQDEPSVARLRLEELERVDADTAAPDMERLNERIPAEKAAVQPSTSEAAVVPAPPPEGPALRVVTAPESPAASTPEAVVARNIGRNEHCPCGSGRKYKKCCEASAASAAPPPAQAVG